MRELVPIITVLVAFCFVIALIFLTRYCMSFFEPYLRRKQHKGALSVLSTLPVDSKRRIYVIRYKNDIALILTGGGNDVLLGWRYGVYKDEASTQQDVERDMRSKEEYGDDPSRLS